MSLRIAMLTADHVEAYVQHVVAHDLESGTEGDLPHGPYSRTVVQDVAATEEKARRRWATEVGASDWRRAWGLFDGARVVGSVHLAGGDLPAGSHRADCGIGIVRAFRGQGWGRKLMVAAIDWARLQHRIAWIDLGVFQGNDRAEALYRKLGFIEVGRVRDRFRVDEFVIDDIQMTLSV